MKKFMMLMGAAAMFSLCAQAESTVTTNGLFMTFEGYTASDKITADKDPGTTTGSAIYWSRPGDTETEKLDGDSIVKDDYPAEGEKYLSVDESTELRRSLGSATEIPENGNITVSTYVKFTASEEENVAFETNVDKLVVWLQATDKATNLIVTASAISGTTGTPTNYIIDNCEVSPDTWYNLKIVALRGTQYPSFNVYIGDTKLESAGVDTFASLALTQGQTITSIGFKGTGAVDDILFTSEAGVGTIPLNVDGDNITNITYKLDGAGDAITYISGATIPATTETIVFTVTPAANYEVKSAVVLKPAASEGGDPEEVVLTVTDNALTVDVATYTTTEGGVTVAFAATAIGGDEPTVDPSQGGTTVTADDATTAISKVTITAPSAITGDAATTYVSYFTKTAVAGSTEGEWIVSAELNSTGTNALQTSVNNGVKATSILDTSATKATITDAVPGFYYQIIGGTAVKSITIRGTAKMATDTTVSDLEKPALGTTTQGFYKVQATVAEPEQPKK